MKKKLILLLMGITLSLTGCGSSVPTVSQEDYDAKVKELEALEESYFLRTDEFKLLQADYDKKVKELENAQKDILDLQSKYDIEHAELTKLQAEFDAIANSETQTNTIQDESLQLFEDVYLPYANREKPFTFYAVKNFANSCGYTADVVNPTDDMNATIKISATNGDYVFFAFAPIDNVDMIMIVSFYHAASNSEVSLENLSSDGSISYDTYNTHVLGEQNKKVNGTDAQRDFLFKEK